MKKKKFYNNYSYTAGLYSKLDALSIHYFDQVAYAENPIAWHDKLQTLAANLCGYWEGQDAKKNV